MGWLDPLLTRMLRDDLFERVPVAGWAFPPEAERRPREFFVAWAGRSELEGEGFPAGHPLYGLFEELLAVNEAFTRWLLRNQMVYGRQTGSNDDARGLEWLAASHPRGVASLAGPLSSESLSRWLAAGACAREGDVALVMNSGQSSRLLRLLRESGREPAYARDAVLRKTLPRFEGLPILVSDYLRDDEAGGGTSIYLVRFGDSTHPRDGGLVKFVQRLVVGARFTSTGFLEQKVLTILDREIGLSALDTGAVQRLRQVEP